MKNTKLFLIKINNIIINIFLKIFINYFIIIKLALNDINVKRDDLTKIKELNILINYIINFLIIIIFFYRTYLISFS